MNHLTTTENNHFRSLKMILEQTESREFSNNELREALQQSLDLVKTMEPSPENQLLRKSLCKAVNDTYRLTIVNSVDFFKDYFETLPQFKTREECFEDLNRTYFKAFGEYKYKDFKAFRKALKID